MCVNLIICVVRKRLKPITRVVATTGFIVSLFTTLILGCGSAVADSVESALVQAYQNNEQLNAQRALVRATDEQVPQALAGYRPRASATLTGGEQSISTTSQLLPQTPGTPAQYFTNSGYNAPYSAGVTIAQTIYNGFQTANRTRAAEAQVFAARETLRITEQSVLLDALTAYMNLLRDFAILELYKRNVTVLTEQLRETRDRFKVGDVTMTDVSQAESRLAGGQTQVSQAEATYKTSVAVYRQVIGVEPGNLSPGSPVDRFCPKTLDESFALIDKHPSVTAAMYGVDVAQLAVKVGEGALLPTLTVQGSAQKSWEQQIQVPEYYSLSILGQLSVPLYQGGAEYSAVRQAKETLGQRRTELDLARQKTRAGIVQAWS